MLDTVTLYQHLWQPFKTSIYPYVAVGLDKITIYSQVDNVILQLRGVRLVLIIAPKI